MSEPMLPGKPARQPQAPRNFGSKGQYGIFHTLLRILGLRGTRPLLALVVLWYTLLPHGRQRAMPYIQRRFAGATPWEILRHCHRLQHSFGTVLLERLMLALGGKGGIIYSPDVAKTLEGCLAKGKGLILLSAHVGAWQGAVPALSFLGRPIHILQALDPRHGDQHFFIPAATAEGKRPEAPALPVRAINVAGPFGGLIEARAALARNELVCSMGDRLLYAEEPAIALPFLGQTVRVPIGVYRLASLTGAPVAVVFMLREPYGPEHSPHPGGANTRLHLAALLEVPASRSRAPDEWRQPATTFMHSLAAVAHEYPYQFFNFYDMWKAQPGLL